MVISLSFVSQMDHIVHSFDMEETKKFLMKYSSHASIR